jgi:predicted acylesterase/phospholipase RssA
VRTIAVAPAGPGAPVGALAVGLERALGRLGGVRRIDARGFAQARPDLPSPLAPGAPDPRIASWLAQQESEGGVLVYEADPEAGAWTQRCLRQADHVVWVAAAGGGGAAWLERALAESRCAADQSFVALEAGSALPTRAPFRFALVLRAAADFDRLARLVTGRAVGVVLGGGGARGLAHLGVLRALEELRIPVDAIGGASVGAVVAALVARGLDAAGVREICQRKFRSVFDPTVPVVAMLRGRRIAARLADAMGERSIEELAIPFLSVSTNLSRGAVRVHRSGPLLRAVRASLAIPGILPPVVEDGELLVDGALLDNLPVLAMRELTGGGPVLAVDVGAGFSSTPFPDLPDELSGWSALRRRFGGPARGGAVPSIFEILMRSAMVSSIGAAGRVALREGIDLCIVPPVQDFGLFAFDRVDEIAERGYRAALEPVRAWWESLCAEAAQG